MPHEPIIVRFMRARPLFGITIAILFTISCSRSSSSVPKYTGKYLLDEHIPAWCFLTPPRSYWTPTPDLTAPHKTWGFQGCFPSWSECVHRQESLRSDAQRNVRSPPREIAGAAGCGAALCGNQKPPPYTLSRQQERELWLKQMEEGVCVSIDDPAIRDDPGSLTAEFLEPPSR